jgi:hypothetical protein
MPSQHQIAPLPSSSYAAIAGSPHPHSPGAVPYILANATPMVYPQPPPAIVPTSFVSGSSAVTPAPLPLQPQLRLPYPNMPQQQQQQQPSPSTPSMQPIIFQAPVTPTHFTTHPHAGSTAASTSINAHPAARSRHLVGASREHELAHIRMLQLHQQRMYALQHHQRLALQANGAQPWTGRS